MKPKIVITQGVAKLEGECLRCNSVRLVGNGKHCGKLLAKLNTRGQLAGCFKCERCNQLLEVQVV